MGREGGREWRVVLSLGSAGGEREREGVKGSFISLGWAGGEGGREWRVVLSLGWAGEERGRERRVVLSLGWAGGEGGKEGGSGG